jgi:uncharacterized protein
MMIINKTKNKVICNNKKILSSIFSKAIGLMFSKRIKDIGYVFVFEKAMRADLHMFFVFFPIDLIFLDENKRVIEIKENFKPFTVYLPKQKARYIIELPEHSVKNTKTEIKDTIAF